MSHIRSMADRMNTAGCADDAWDTALTFLPELGLSKVVFLDLSAPIAPTVRSNAGDVWTRSYARSVTSGQDPFAANCLSRVNPMLTGIAHLETYNYLDDSAKDLIAQGSETLGIRTGMSVTLCPDSTGAGVGWNLMSAHSVAEFAQLRETHEADWRAWCQLTFAGLTMHGAQTDRAPLTARERDCLAYVADGLRTADVAHRLGIAETTVEMHLRRGRQRIGAKTRDQAVARAIRQGLI